MVVRDTEIRQAFLVQSTVARPMYELMLDAESSGTDNAYVERGDHVEDWTFKPGEKKTYVEDADEELVDLYCGERWWLA